MNTPRADFTRHSASARSSHAELSRLTTMNPLAQRRAANAASGVQTLRLDKGELMASSEKEWTPKSMMAIMDGADAALILAGIGTEEDIENCIPWYKAKARSRPNALQQVHRFACAWRIALAMRLGTFLREAAKDIMQDVTAFQEAVLLPAAQTKPHGGKGGRPYAHLRPQQPG